MQIDLNISNDLISQIRKEIQGSIWVNTENLSLKYEVEKLRKENEILQNKCQILIKKNEILNEKCESLENRVKSLNLQLNENKMKFEKPIETFHEDLLESLSDIGPDFSQEEVISIGNKEKKERTKSKMAKSKSYCIDFANIDVLPSPIDVPSLIKRIADSREEEINDIVIDFIIEKCDSLYKKKNRVMDVVNTILLKLNNDQMNDSQSLRFVSFLTKLLENIAPDYLKKIIELSKAKPSVYNLFEISTIDDGDSSD